MLEQQIQKKIVTFLEKKGFWTIVTIVCNRSGIPDLLACDPKGRMWAIEVKTENGRASKLQKVNIEKLLARGGVAFICYGYDDFLMKYNNRAVT